ncbi:urea ABC transporter permease subunit UrtC [uncultured Amphritea sp.]|uniref:urea ABC transporter permease subunit UrtC n=1 Tax=uncultured Amphritea sp. TaxID=981605 RepID=UPI0026147C5A|nr:urea ABC transporter permease subunit UrtC [uncultured Amphritea sp.]
MSSFLTNFMSFSRINGESKVAPFVVLLLAVTALASASNLLMPQDSVFYVSTYTITLLGKYLCYAMLALAVDVIWGYCGILSLGHGAFFALGGYAMGMYLMRQIGDRGVYGNPELPDFMVFLNWSELPWFWQGMDQFWVAMLMVLLVPGILAYVFGWLAFRSRVTGVYLSIMTQALTYALLLSFFRNEMGFGGNNGLTDFKDIIGFDLQSDNTRVSLFIITALLLCGLLVLSKKIMQTRFGKVIVAIRDGESRARFIGYRTENYKVWLFVYSAMIAGIAGALYVPQVGIINPGEFSPINSIEIVIWVAVGGRGTLIGAIIGAILVNYAKTKFTAIMPDGWLFALGAMFVLVTLYLPKGLMGLVAQLKDQQLQSKQRSANNSSNEKAEEGHA